MGGEVKLYFPDTSVYMCFVNHEPEVKPAKQVLDNELITFYIVARELDGIFENRRSKKNRLLFEITKFKKFIDMKNYLCESCNNKNDFVHFNQLFDRICKELRVKPTDKIEAENLKRIENKIFEIWNSQSTKLQLVIRKSKNTRSPIINFEDGAYHSLYAALSRQLRPKLSEDHDFKILTAGIWYGLTSYPDIEIVSKDNFFIENRDAVNKLVMKRERYIEEQQIPFNIKFLTEVR
jgi:hypothetical protein